MICLPQHMIRQKRQNNRIYLTFQNPFCTCRLEIAVFIICTPRLSAPVKTLHNIYADMPSQNAHIFVIQYL